MTDDVADLLNQLRILRRYHRAAAQPGEEYDDEHGPLSKGICALKKEIADALAAEDDAA